MGLSNTGVVTRPAVSSSFCRINQDALHFSILGRHQVKPNIPSDLAPALKVQKFLHGEVPAVQHNQVWRRPARWTKLPA
jgi:hypothetical protein